KLAVRLAPRGVLQPVLFGSPAPPGTLAEVPLVGGSPRELLENVSDGDYSPDGSALLVLRNMGGRDRLELPIGKVLFEEEPGVTIAHPRFSPNGDGIAFIESRWGKGVDSLAFVDLAGRKRTLGPLTLGFALAWNPKTDEVWVTDHDPAQGMVLVAVSRSGRRRVIAGGTDVLLIREISADGRALISSVKYPASMMCQAPGAPREVDLAWLDFSHSMDISADGTLVLFTEFGLPVGSQSGIYLRKSDASPAVRLSGSHQTDAALSPDKKWAVAADNGAITL